MIEPILVVLIFTVVVAVVVSPLLKRSESSEGRDDAAKLEQLRLSRDSKLAEIKEAELDLHAHKLSERDYDALDSELRLEAAKIIAELNEVERSSSNNRG